MKNVVEVDQSIKIEDAGATVLAFANGIDNAVTMPSKVKRLALSTQVLQGRSREVARLKLFAVGLYLLLENYLEHLERVDIDTEYTGHEQRIREFLLILIWRRYPGFESWRVTFKQVGKKSPAHKKAERVRKRKDKGYRTLTTEEVLELLR
jgi:hypothetical protein